MSYKTHGLEGTPTYKTWQMMKQRCSNPKATGYHLWGGRGITYDPRWEKFENFLGDMGLRPFGQQLERKNTNGPYCKENCIWATSRTQNNNRRNTIFVELNGERKSLAEWARHLGISKKTLDSRYFQGVRDPEKLLTSVRSYDMSNR